MEIVGCVLSWLRYISNATDVIDGMRQLCLAGNWVMGSVYGAPIAEKLGRAGRESRWWSVLTSDKYHKLFDGIVG